VGGGIAGLVASIACAEAGAPEVRLLEAHPVLGGVGRSTDGPWIANLGPHALYTTTELWPWLRDRKLVPAFVPASTARARVRWQGRLRLAPPVLRKALGIRRHLTDAPVDASFRDWATTIVPDDAVQALCGAAGVLTFDADPGRLSAAFVAERLDRIVFQPRNVARYVVGGWSRLIDSLADGARARGVRIETNARLEALPEDGPVIVAAGGTAAARLLDDPTLAPRGTRTALLDVGLRHRRGEPSAVLDLDHAGFATRVTSVDRSMAPPGHEVVQLCMGVAADDDLAAGVGRLETLLDDTFAGWRDREAWRRRSIVEHRTGALDLPGTTWRDRPAVDRGSGVFVCGDQVAAPGHLAEVAWGSALEAAALATAAVRIRV
jgi:phytoene dehydrogenase-like protein